MKELAVVGQGVVDDRPEVTIWQVCMQGLSGAQPCADCHHPATYYTRRQSTGNS
jgi:hypothetical protein